MRGFVEPCLVLSERELPGHELRVDPTARKPVPDDHTAAVEVHAERGRKKRKAAERLEEEVQHVGEHKHLDGLDIAPAPAREKVLRERARLRDEQTESAEDLAVEMEQAVRGFFRNVRDREVVLAWSALINNFAKQSLRG
jgi:tRNA U55 pseudouridine synthase TruB